MPMIEAILRFFKMQIKHPFLNSIKLTEPLLCITPKRLYAINMTFSTGKFIITMIYSQLITESSSICPRIMPCRVALEQSGTISVYTFPSRLSNPNTIVLPDAPRPHL